ncbi:MAG: lysylphosphatidylglycerol synthase domain-containing protein [Candidatus Micrarchaeota archaeon]|nr:lysylphosphatidylglycerol synthase domain-containing protein [Candidatus Micrarchaeota archaeon]
MKKNLLLFANVFAALALAYVFLSSAGLSGVAERFSGLRAEWLALGGLLYAGMNLLNSFRIAWTLKTNWTAKLFFQHMTAMLVSDFTPGRAGYAAMVQKLRVTGVKGGPAAKSLGVLFIADFLARALLAVFAVAYFGSTIKSDFFVWAAGVLLALGAGGWFLLAYKNGWLERTLNRVPMVGKRLARMYAGAVALDVKAGFLAANVGLSLVGAAFRGAAWTMAFVALGLGGFEVFPAATLVSALVTVASFIPVSLAGVGVQEGLGAYLFSAALALPISAAAAVMVACRVMEFGTDALLGWRELLTGWRKKDAT